jgi:hypothetical protein
MKQYKHINGVIATETNQKIEQNETLYQYTYKDFTAYIPHILIADDPNWTLIDTSDSIKIESLNMTLKEIGSTFHPTPSAFIIKALIDYIKKQYKL